MSCSTSTMALTPACFPAAISVFMMPCLSAVETPEVGSSSRMTCGSSANAEATSSSFFSPCDSAAATASSRARRPKMSATSCDAGADLVVGGEPREQPPALPLPRHHRGRDRLRDREPRKDRDELERAREAAIGERDRADAGDVLAPKQNLAGVGGNSPVSRLTSVVLPAPFGPTTETSSPARPRW